MLRLRPELRRRPVKTDGRDVERWAAVGSGSAGGVRPIRYAVRAHAAGEASKCGPVL